MVMTPLILFNFLIAISTAVWSIIATVYVYPSLRTLPWHEAVLPLVLLHAFRFLPMIGFGPGQMEQDLPDKARAAADGMAWGDLIASLTAIVTSLLLLIPATQNKWVVWVFMAIALGDNLIAFTRAAIANLFQYYLGFNAQIAVLYVPTLMVSYVLIVLLIYIVV